MIPLQDEVVEYAGEEDTLKHDQVADDLAGKEGVLQLLVLNEVVEPLFAETRHATHFEKVRTL